MFYVLRCVTCDNEAGILLEIPFASAIDRDRWAIDHHAGTGHDEWIAFETTSEGIVGPYRHLRAGYLERNMTVRVRSMWVRALDGSGNPTGAWRHIPAGDAEVTIMFSEEQP